MKASDIPAKFPVAWASSAGSSYIRAIPKTTTTLGAASLEAGFPPADATPQSAGGVPPSITDFNGILNQVTAWLQWQSAGVFNPFDSAFVSDLGGYPKGAVVLSSVTDGLMFFNTVDDNTTDPEGTSPANWLSYKFGQTVEVGSVQMFMIAPTSLQFPSGYLELNGAAISRTTYATLFSKIGTIGGSGDGSTTFNLPDMRGVVPRGFDNGRGLDPSRAFGSYQADAYASHSHGVSDPGHAHGVYDPGHHHSWYTTNGSAGGNYMSIINGDNSIANTWTDNNAATGIGINAAGTGISINAAGGSETRGKNVALTLAIKY